MRLALEEGFNAPVSKELIYEFDISEDGLYLIEISARAKSWLQNTLKLISFFKDDDLAVQIDAREFPKIGGKIGLFDSEAAWNGNKLKNLQQINVFVTQLSTGKHFLRFIADQSPRLETVKIYQAESRKDVVFEPIKNYQIESGNRRPWLVFIVVDLALARLKIQASADQEQSDDDDLQLKIDGERQINNTPQSHKYWYWCGRALKGQERTFNQKLNLSAGLHYIELWADNVPVLEGLELVFSDEGKHEEKDILITPYTYRGVKGDEDYNRYDAMIKEVVDCWNNKFLQDTDPPKEILDPNLVKAIMYQESRVGYYSGEVRGEIDVMQIGDPDNPALRTLKGELREYWIHNGKQMVLEYANAKIETVQDSIYWGARWLYHKAQGITADGGRYWRAWKEAVHRYGPGTKEYTDSVWHIYKNGIKKERNDIIRLWEIALILLLSGFLLWGHDETNVLKALVADSFSPKQRPHIQDVEVRFYQDNPLLFLAVVEWEKDWWEELKIGTVRGGVTKWLEIENPPSEQSILSARFINLDGFSRPVLELYGYSHKGLGSLYLFEIKGDKLSLIFKVMAVDSYNEGVWNPENYQKYGYGACGEIYKGGKLSATYRDKNKDGVSDITLEGKTVVICEKEILTDDFYRQPIDVKVSEVPVKKIYLWDENSQSFSEERINGVRRGRSYFVYGLDMVLI